MVLERQLGFMQGRTTMEAIYLRQRLVKNKKYRERKDLDMVFIDFENAYDQVP